MPSPLLKKISEAATLNPQERDALEAMIVQTVEVAAGEDIAVQGDSPLHSTVLLAGLSYRYCTLGDGRRAVLAFEIEGDWTDLHSLFLDQMDHSVGAITACTVGKVPHRSIHDFVRRFPHLGFALWREATYDSAVLRQWLVNASARDARARMAHLFCEMHWRNRAIGLGEPTSFHFPVTQVLLADATGVSVVHANRVLQQLKSDGLLDFARHHAVIPDPAALWRAADFDPRYLKLTRGVDGPGQ